MIPAFNQIVSIIGGSAGYRDPVTGAWVEGGVEVTSQVLGSVQPLKEGQNLTVTATGHFYETEHVVVYIKGSYDLEPGSTIHVQGKFWDVSGAQDWTLPRMRNGGHTKLLCTLSADQDRDVVIPAQETM